MLERQGNDPHVSIANQNNLHNPDWSNHEDDKHIKRHNNNIYPGNPKNEGAKVEEIAGEYSFRHK